MELSPLIFAKDKRSKFLYVGTLRAPLTTRCDQKSKLTLEFYILGNIVIILTQFEKENQCKSGKNEKSKHAWLGKSENRKKRVNLKKKRNKI